MRRLLPTLVLVLAVGMLGAGTWTTFQDTETSTGNTFQAGTLDLNQVDFTASWTAANIAPGDPDLTAERCVTMRRSGSITPDHLEITVDYTLTEGSPDDPDMVDPDGNPTEADDFAQEVIVSAISYGAEDLLDDITATADSHSGKSLADIKLQGGFDDLDIPPTSGSVSFCMKLDDFHSDAPNHLQGDTLDVDVIFTLNQTAGQ